MGYNQTKNIIKGWYRYKKLVWLLVLVEIFSFQPIQIEIREDDKIDDVDTGTMRVAICDGGSGKTEITVTESGSKYDGNTAVWEVACEVKLVGKQ